MNWIEKYCPKKWEDFNDNNGIKEFMIKWMEKGLQINEWKPLLLIGGHQIGKKILSRLLFEKYGFKVHILDYFGDISIKKQLTDILVNKNIISFFSNCKVPKRAVLIPNLEIYIQTNEKGVLNDISSIFNIKKNKTREKKFLNSLNKPIILTTSDEYTKKIKMLKRFCSFTKMIRPNFLQMISLINNICKSKKIRISKKNKIYIIKKSNYRYTNLIRFLYEIKLNKSLKHCKNKLKVNYIVDSLCNKDHEYVFEFAISKIFQQKMSTDELKNIYFQDTFLLPQMMFENYHYYFDGLNLNNNEKVLAAKQLLNGYCLGDINQTKCFKTQNWFMNNYGLYYSIVPTNSLFGFDGDIDIKKLEKRLGNIYSSLLNKFSLKKTYKKMIINSYFNYKICPKELRAILEYILFHLYDKNGLKRNGKNIMKKNNWNINDLHKISKNFQMIRYKEYLKK